MSIPLPPLPVQLNGRKDARIPDAVFRARDQEIVRCVLEAAANEAGQWFTARHIADAIRELEFHHHE